MPSVHIEIADTVPCGLAPIRPRMPSLEALGTIAFGVDVIRPLICLDPGRPGVIDPRRWLAVVPEAYRDDALAIIEWIRARYQDRVATPATLDAFAEDVSEAAILTVPRR